MNNSGDKSQRVLVVGGGLTGAFLCASLCRRGHVVTLVDDAQGMSATRVAAGLYNVVTGRLAALTWQAQTLLDTVTAFFHDPQFAPLAHLLHPMPIYRPFLSVAEVNDWSLKALEPPFSDLVTVEGPGQGGDFFADPLGGLRILPCGWVDCGPLVAGILDHLHAHWGLRWLAGPFDYAALDPVSATWRQGASTETFDAVVFAEGVGVLHNPFFPGLPLHPLKGQIMDAEIEGPDLEQVLSRKIYLIPRGGQRYTVGATYEPRYETTAVTQAGIDELSGHLRSLVKRPFRILEARAALRPTTPNRRPILGQHPQHPRLWLVNGMGTKGVLQAPWCAERLADMLAGIPLPMQKEISLHRFSEKMPIFKG